MYNVQFKYLIFARNARWPPKRGHGTIFGDGNIQIHLLDTLRITKKQVRKIYQVGAWELPFPTRLKFCGFQVSTQGILIPDSSNSNDLMQLNGHSA